jgi:hypothetical protein
VVVPRPEGLVAVFEQLRPLIEELDAVAMEFTDAEREVIQHYLERVNEVLRERVSVWRSEG